ncbi:hypothetical protein [Hymenobacter sp. PAMC 26628]|uniref:hypothetical protein n=1 Tax=Hymenobacter sp. PAMC 26628 TaxID=1484118 RepID=UPI000B16B7A4|nr:hypothetical protein [Hymenobacter sp. PAMC 26628]
MESFFSSQTISIISLALLVVGFSKFIIYYKAFNISIVDYIDPSEIITLFADNIATASVIVMVLAVPYIGLILPYNLSGIDIGLEFFERLSRHFSLLLPLVAVGFVFLVVFLLILWRRPKIENFELARYIWAWPTITILVPMMSLESGSYYSIQSFQQYVIILSLIISFTFLILLATWNEIQKVKTGYFSNVEVEFESDTLKSNVTEFYVGKTKSYLFFYSTQNKTSTAYLTGKLKSIKYTPQ